MEAERAVSAARSLIGDAAPLRFDCGMVCGRACCQAGEQGEGMLLFPGEERLYRRLPEGFSLADSAQMPGARLLTCGGRCERADRPLACRFFPLVPLAETDESGALRLKLALDCRAWPVCPLMDSGFAAFEPSFLNGCRAAARALFQNAQERQFLLRLTALIGQYKTPLWEDFER